MVPTTSSATAEMSSIFPAEPDSCCIETSISFVLHPCSQTLDFLPVSARMSVFEGNKGSEEND